MSDPGALPSPAITHPTAGDAGRDGHDVGSGVAVAASSAGSNVLGALITIALARYYTGAEFGALASLLAIAIVAVVPATGMQYVIARRTAQAGLDDREHDRTSLRYAAVLGVAIGLGVCALSPALGVFLDVPIAAVLVVGLCVPPYTINSAQLGSLLARHSLVRFATGQVLLATMRFAGVALACALHADVTGVIVGLFIATVLAVVCCVPLTGLRTWTVTLPADRAFTTDILRASLDLAGVSVVLNLDLLLARHFLSASDSGVYALGALFAKAGLWAAQFVPQLIFARMSKAEHRRALLARAVVADLGVGALVLIGALVLAGPALRIVSGDADPVAAAKLAPLFALLGAGWALCYLVLLASVATGDRGPSRALWTAVLVETAIVVIVAHHSAMQILGTITACTGVLAAAIVAWSYRASPQRTG